MSERFVKNSKKLEKKHKKQESLKVYHLNRVAEKIIFVSHISLNDYVY
jgi:hypothetical protein